MQDSIILSKISLLNLVAFVHPVSSQIPAVRLPSEMYFHIVFMLKQMIIGIHIWYICGIEISYPKISHFSVMFGLFPPCFITKSQNELLTI